MFILVSPLLPEPRSSPPPSRKPRMSRLLKPKLSQPSAAACNVVPSLCSFTTSLAGCQNFLVFLLLLWLPLLCPLFSFFCHLTPTSQGWELTRSLLDPLLLSIYPPPWLTLNMVSLQATPTLTSLSSKALCPPSSSAALHGPSSLLYPSLIS